MKMLEQGRPWEDIQKEMQARGASDAKWRDGRTAVYVFNAGEEIAAIQKEAYAAFRPWHKWKKTSFRWGLAYCTVPTAVLAR